MIILGYHFDTDYLNDNLRDELENHDLWIGGYSRGITQPTEGIFGIEIESKIPDRGSLFAPTVIKSKNYPKETEWKVFEAFGELSLELQKKSNCISLSMKINHQRTP